MADVVEPPLQPSQPANSGGMSLNPVTDVANKTLTQVGNAANSQEQNASGTLLAPEETQAATKAAAQSVPGMAQQAQGALTQPAQYEQQQGMEQGQQTQQQGNSAATYGNLVQQEQHQALLTATQESHNSILAAGDQMTKTAQLAAIDPNKYLKDLGVSGRLITALGMLISGAGSGLTGQPNLALEMFNKNIQRDIDGQKETFLNNYNALKGNISLTETSQHQQMISAQAGAAAALSVATGANVALQGMQANVKSNYAPAVADQAKLSIQNILMNSQAQYNKLYGMAVSSQDMLQMNGVGMLGNAAKQAMGGNRIQPPTSRFNLNVGGKGEQPQVPSQSPEQQMSMKSNPSESQKAGVGIPSGNMFGNYKGSLLEALANGQVSKK